MDFPSHTYARPSPRVGSVRFITRSFSCKSKIPFVVCLIVKTNAHCRDRVVQSNSEYHPSRVVLPLAISLKGIVPALVNQRPTPSVSISSVQVSRILPCLHHHARKAPSLYYRALDQGLQVVSMEAGKESDRDRACEMIFPHEHGSFKN